MIRRLAIAAPLAFAALPLHAQGVRSRVDETTLPLRLESVALDHAGERPKTWGDPVDIPPRLFSLSPYGWSGPTWVADATPARLNFPSLGWTTDPLLHDTSIRLVQQLQQVRMTDGRTAWENMQRIMPSSEVRGASIPTQPPAPPSPTP